MDLQTQLTICGLQIHIHPKSGVDKEIRLGIQLIEIKLNMVRLSL